MEKTVKQWVRDKLYQKTTVTATHVQQKVKSNTIFGYSSSTQFESTWEFPVTESLVKIHSSIPDKVALMIDVWESPTENRVVLKASKQDEADWEWIDRESGIFKRHVGLLPYDTNCVCVGDETILEWNDATKSIGREERIPGKNRLEINLKSSTFYILKIPKDCELWVDFAKGGIIYNEFASDQRLVRPTRLHIDAPKIQIGETKQEQRVIDKKMGEGGEYVPLTNLQTRDGEIIIQLSAFYSLTS